MLSSSSSPPPCHGNDSNARIIESLTASVRGKFIKQGISINQLLFWNGSLITGFQNTIDAMCQRFTRKLHALAWLWLLHDDDVVEKQRRKYFRLMRIVPRENTNQIEICWGSTSSVFRAKCTWAEDSIISVFIYCVHCEWQPKYIRSKYGPNENCALSSLLV